jgi:Family of unknown function (DUF6263)
MQFIKTGLLAISLTGAVSSMAQPVKIGVMTGQKYKVETTTKVNSSAEVMGQTMENNIDSKNTTLYEIKGAGQDGIALQATITNMAVTANAMGQEMSFDSDKKDNSGPMADMLTTKINKAKSITLDTKGSITKQDAEEESSQAAMMGLGDANSTTVELFLPALVGRDLKAGDSFTDVGSVKKEKFSSRDSGTYKITAIENGVASISYTGTQVVNSTMEQMGMEMTNNSNNIVKTELQVDVNTGLILLKASVIESTVSIEAAGMTIPASGKTTVTSKITPIQ